MMASGFSLRGLSLVTTTRSAFFSATAAIALAVREAAANDVILLAGKGHETFQDIGGVKHDFDDRVHAAQALQGRVAA